MKRPLHPGSGACRLKGLVGVEQYPLGDSLRQLRHGRGGLRLGIAPHSQPQPVALGEGGFGDGQADAAAGAADQQGPFYGGTLARGRMVRQKKAGP